MKHTPGPWKMKFKKNCDWSVYGKDGYSILAIPYDNDNGRPTEDKANAALIAAAPELLSALKLAVHHESATWKDVDALHRCIELISKLRGEK
jgi:hypothetical protein